MVRDDENNPPVFFMGVGSSDSEDESDVRFRQKLIHQQLIGEIMGDNFEHYSYTPNHLSRLSIEAPELTLHSEGLRFTADTLPPYINAMLIILTNIAQNLYDRGS